MKQSILLFIIFFSFILIACQPRTPNVNKISLAMGGCNQTETCPFITIEIDSSLNYKHYCFSGCDNTGLFSGKLPDTLWQKLSVGLGKDKLQNPNDSFEVNREDEFIEMRIHKGNKAYNLKGYKNNFSKTLRQSIDQIMTIHQKIKLTRTTDLNPDNLNFEIPIPMNNYYTLPIPNKRRPQ